MALTISPNLHHVLRLYLTYSAVPLAYLCGIYPHSSWATIAANIIFLSVLVAVKGNVARLVDHLRH
ncbi:phage holin family protein [Enterobacter hormaechei]|uniref:phage holin family protein n=1 Tax=Enterobacter hormaechei TaxID=158836 RepID=UPI00188157FE|nr:phage holin family protein [Enterobacter hormaechei]MBE8837258.1 phage holin family protein [Enterobacter hormaechei]